MNNLYRSSNLPIWPIAVCHFLSSFNEELIRILAALFLIGLYPTEGAARVASFCSMASWLPHLIFFGSSGVLADRYDRTKIFTIAKTVSFLATLMTGVSFYFNTTIGTLASLFLFFSHSAFIIPVKYSMVPDLFSQENIAKVNSIFSSTNKIACVLGQPIAALLIDLTRKNFSLCCGLCCLIAFLDILVSTLLLGKSKQRPQPSKKATIHLLSDAINTVKTLQHSPSSQNTLYAYVFVYFAAGALKTNVVPYAMIELGLEATTGFFLMIYSGLGFVTGAIISEAILEKISHHNVMTTTMAGTSIVFFLLFFMPSFYCVLPLLALFGITMGLFFVSAHSFIQLHTNKQSIGKIFSVFHFYGLLGSFIASGLILGCADGLNIRPRNIFLILSLCMTTFSLIFKNSLSKHTRR